MKLLRYGPAGAEKPGLLDPQGTMRDLSAHIDDINGNALSPESLQKLSSIDTSSLPEVDSSLRLGPPVGQVGKVICVGLNYRDHAEETGLPIPDEPVLFQKATSAICGPNDDVWLPPGSKKLDWEVELGIVIGREARRVDEANAMDYVAGFTIVNDVSERGYQIDGTGQWTKGKSHDRFCPFGPVVVTKDAIGKPEELDIWLEVDGKRMQDPHWHTAWCWSRSHTATIPRCRQNNEARYRRYWRDDQSRG